MSSHVPTLGVEILSARGLSVLSYQNEALQSIRLHVLFQNNIHESNDIVLDKNDDIVFDFTTSYPLNIYDYDKNSMNTLNNNPILVYLTSTSVNGNGQQPMGIDFTRSLIAMAIIDYRMAFMYGGEYISVELMAQDNDGMSFHNGIGSLYVRLSLANVLSPYSSATALESAIEFDIQRHAEVSRNVHTSAKNWWARLRRDYPFIESRDIKLFAEDECNQHRIVSAFIAPVIPPRELDNPKMTARFVSLIPFKREFALTGGRRGTWQSPHSFLSTMQGDVEDHAILLACLLLGWGMDVWVAIGTISPGANNKEGSNSGKRPHMWVVTMDSLSEGKVIFWEALTGQQYDINIDISRKGKFVISPSTLTPSAKLSRHPFLELHALFRNDVFLLNVQRNPLLYCPDDSVTGTLGVSMNLKDSTCWSSFSVKESQNLLRHPGSDLILSSSTIDGTKTRELEVNLETYLKSQLKSWRSEKGLQTHIDDKLSLILQTALSSYELDRTLGVSAGNSDFQCAVKRYVNKGECFKAYPTCFSHTDAATISSTIRQANSAKDVVFAQSTHNHGDRYATRHALRVKIIPYPKGALAVWVITAVCYSG